jgi:hypothetical protein
MQETAVRKLCFFVISIGYCCIACVDMRVSHCFVSDSLPSQTSVGQIIEYILDELEM